MTESLADRIAARLERLAEMDLAAAEHVHAQLLAAEEPKAVAELARAYQRESRTLRQTLMLQMRHAREQAQAAAEAARSPGSLGLGQESALDRLVNGRIEDLQDAVGRVAAAAHPDSPKRQREALDRLDVELDHWADDEDFIDERLDEAVLHACERVGLPMALARQWEDLPRPAQTFDPATAPPVVPQADTG